MIIEIKTYKIICDNSKCGAELILQGPGEPPGYPEDWEKMSLTHPAGHEVTVGICPSCSRVNRKARFKVIK